MEFTFIIFIIICKLQASYYYYYFLGFSMSLLSFKRKKDQKVFHMPGPVTTVLLLIGRRTETLEFRVPIVCRIESIPIDKFRSTVPCFFCLRHYFPPSVASSTDRHWMLVHGLMNEFVWNFHSFNLYLMSSAYAHSIYTLYDSHSRRHPRL